jgi:hypothetical protein
MAATYEVISKNVLGSNTSSITFSTIPQTFTDLVMIINGGDTGAVQPGIRFNGDSGSNYSRQNLTGNGSTAYGTGGQNDSLVQFGWDAYMTSAYSYLAIINVPNYTNTVTNKAVIGRSNNANTGVTASVALWRNTSAITSMTLLQSYGSDLFLAGTTFTLYGIKAGS